MKKKRYIEKVRVKDPCTQDWNEMTGNDQVRFCTHCAKDVNDLSTMTKSEARRLVRQSNGQLCIRYIKHPETGAPVFTDQLVQISRRMPRVAAGVIGASISLSTFAYAQGGSSRAASSPQVETPAAVVAVNPPSESKPGSDGKTTVEPAAFGSLTGKVVDAIDAVIPGVVVSLRDANGNEIFRTTSDDEGVYRIESVPFARYSLVATAANFREHTQELRIRDPNQRVTNVTLDVGQIVILGGAMAISRVAYQGALMLAVEDDELEKARELIAAGEDVDRQEDDDTTPLFVAVERGNLEMVRLLLDFGAKVNARDEEKQTPLMRLDEDTPVALVELLLRSGAKVNRVADDGDTALIRAADGDVAPEVLKALIDAGAELDVQNDEGRTALMNAANSGILENVRLLILAGADVNLRDNEGDNAWDRTSEERSRIYS